MPPRLPTMKPRFNNPPTTANPGAKTEMSSTTDSANEFNSDEELPSLELSPVSSENNTNVSGSLASSGTDDGAASMTLIMQVTIIVGASMLTLNISIFTAVYVQRISKKCGGANTEAETGAPPEVAPEPVEEEPEEDSNSLKNLLYRGQNLNVIPKNT
ncbi:hypothetical protein CDAR_115231 [Caerostris darwini]|uniref:Uncharacterized protein n=1 Tax=Caerostris darwini TaxID=1538125 RepID=A0AAV4U9X1_9ARAC|nr:hypothetical protein CDAR_115231 [Caerostris darwini]